VEQVNIVYGFFQLRHEQAAFQLGVTFASHTAENVLARRWSSN
jgi:hypothetical protein